MVFERMPLEIWFDEYQFEVDYDIGESGFAQAGIAVKKHMIQRFSTLLSRLDKNLKVSL